MHEIKHESFFVLFQPTVVQFVLFHPFVHSCNIRKTNRQNETKLQASATSKTAAAGVGNINA